MPGVEMAEPESVGGIMSVWRTQIAIALFSFAVLVGFGRAHAQGNDADLAQQLSNPLANLISVPLQTNWDDGYGTGNGYKVFTNVQPVILIELSPSWNGEEKITSSQRCGRTSPNRIWKSALRRGRCGQTSLTHFV